ncbi:hypothetical protein AB3S75_019173 [Citrus x aurantiifolia]
MAMAMAHVWSHDDLCIWESSNLLPLEISEPQVFNVNLSVMFLQESSALQIFCGIGRRRQGEHCQKVAVEIRQFLVTKNQQEWRKAAAKNQQK